VIGDRDSARGGPPCRRDESPRDWDRRQLYALAPAAAFGYLIVWIGRGLGGLLAGVAGPEQTGPGAWGIAGVVVVGATASVATALWWEHADHDR